MKSNKKLIDLKRRKRKFEKERTDWVFQKGDMPDYAYESVLRMYMRILNSINAEIHSEIIRLEEET
ncbi:MAG: hypothetical protein R6T92_03050, partial [Desulfosalsimonadaceae bacterium]